MEGGAFPEQGVESGELVEVTRNSSSVVTCLVKETVY